MEARCNVKGSHQRPWLPAVDSLVADSPSCPPGAKNHVYLVHKNMSTQCKKIMSTQCIKNHVHLMQKNCQHLAKTCPYDAKNHVHIMQKKCSPDSFLNLAPSSPLFIIITSICLKIIITRTCPLHFITNWRTKLIQTVFSTITKVTIAFVFSSSSSSQ